jgi:hypothetical protein
MRIARRIDPFETKAIMPALRQIHREKIATAFDFGANVGARQSPEPC